MTFTNGDILRAEELNAMLDDIESLKLQVLAALGESSEISVTTFGAVGDGVANDRTAFSTAHSTVDPSRAIYVPAGTYNLGVEDLITDARRWIFGGTVTFTAGRLRQSLFEIHNSTSGTIDEFYDPGALFWLNRTRRMGGARQNPAFNLGSADPESPHGTAFFADGHPNFVALQPDDPYNPVEINLYNYCTVGRGTSVVGTNQITRNLSAWSASMPFLPEFIGKCLYWNGVKYKVLTVPNQNTVTVSLMNGTAVSFTSAITKTYHFTYTIFRSVVNVSGTAVTRVKGHRFFDYLVTALNNPTSVIVINGTQYSVESVTDADHLTLTSSAGTLTNASATAYAEIDGETTALRLNHAMLGEQLTIMTSAGSQDGLGAAYLFKEDKGAGDWYPMVFQIAGRDGLAVANDLTTGKTFIGVGDGRRKPTCELDVNGMIRNSHLSLRQNSIERYDEDADGTVVAINYSGYAGGNTRTRDLEIYNGKGALIARASGATKVIDFINTPTVGGVPISGGGGGGVSSVVDVTAFGATGDFVPAPGSTGAGTDNSAAFDAAMASGKPLYIPDGNFYVGSWPTRANFLKHNSEGPGRVWASTNVGITQIGKTLSIGTVRSHEMQSVGGLLLGGESAGQGMRQWMGHHNWMQWQPTRDGAPNQIQIYSSANMCSASCQAPNILNAVNGSFNISKMEVGDHFGWNGEVFKIAGINSTLQISVTTFAGGSPGFTTSGTARPFYHAYESAEGTCNTSGTTVTYVSGEQYPYGVSGDHMYAIINGTRYTVTSGPESLDANHLTLATSAGVQTNATLVFRRCYGPWAYVSLLRLQGLGGGVETNCGLYLNIKNEAVLYNGATSDNLAGNMRINAPRIRLGNDDGSEQVEVGIGYTTLGGYPGACSLRIPKVANAINYLETAGSPSGYASYLAARGQDANPDMGFDLKGVGAFRWTSGTFARTVFEAYAPAGSGAWPTVAADTTTPAFGVAGSATNIDLKLQPKGTGKTIVGSQLVANSGSWVSMSFNLLNGWTDATWGISAKYRLDVGSRVVRLSGQISGGANGSKIFVLPAEYRPSRTVMLSTVGSGVTAAAVQILADGSVHGFGSGSPVTQVVLDGLTFPID